jgi:RimJ/RimL family protein N-acetyltransferase
VIGLVPPDPGLTDGVVVLRPFEPGDVQAVRDACQDPDIQRFLPLPTHYTEAVAEAYVARTRRQWSEGTTAAFAVVEAADPRHVVGAINVAVVDAVGTSGYWVAPWARGRGVATRALRLLTDWALRPPDAGLGLGVVLLEIRPDNLASQHVARAAGYRCVGSIDVNATTGETDGLIFSRLASDPPLEQPGERGSAS